MGLVVSVKINIDQPLEALNALGDDLMMWEEYYKSIGASLVDYFSGQVFISQGGVLDEPWPELSEAYNVWKAEEYPGRPPLVREGEMQESFYYDADDDSLTIGNSSDHFIYHQSSETREKIPRRVMMAINNDVESIIAYGIDNGITEKLQKAGF